MKRSSFNLAVGLFATLLVGSAMGQHPAYRHSQAEVQTFPHLSNRMEFSSFRELRAELLRLFGGAGARIWVTTSLFTDGDLASSLFVGSYRNIDVRILLGKSLANSALSRLRYFKTQNMPVYLHPQGFDVPEPTVILIDQRMVFIDGPLDAHSGTRRYQLRNANDNDKMLIEKGFQSAFEERINPRMPSLPLVGRPRNATQPPVISSPPAPKYRGEEDGSFNYNRVQHGRRPPGGVAAKLPEKTVWQMRQEEQVDQALQDRQQMELREPKFGEEK